MFNYKEANTDIIVNFHNSLNEKDKRRYAAMIYKNSSWNIEYVSKLLLISENTIRKGYGELLNIDALTGGFNFQAAWSGSYVISEHLSNKI